MALGIFICIMENTRKSGKIFYVLLVNYNLSPRTYG